MLTKPKLKRRRRRKVETQVRKSTRLGQGNRTDPTHARSSVHNSFKSLGKKRSKVKLKARQSKEIASSLKYFTNPVKQTQLRSEEPYEYEEPNGQRKQASKHKVFKSTYKEKGNEKKLRSVEIIPIIVSMEQGHSQEDKYNNGQIGSTYLEKGPGYYPVNNSADEKLTASKKPKVEESDSSTAEVTENIPDVQNEDDEQTELQKNSIDDSSKDPSKKPENNFLPAACKLDKEPEFENPVDGTFEEFLELSSTVDDEDVRAFNDLLDSREYKDSTGNVSRDIYDVQSDLNRPEEPRENVCVTNESKDSHELHMGNDDKFFHLIRVAIAEEDNEWITPEMKQLMI